MRFSAAFLSSPFASRVAARWICLLLLATFAVGCQSAGPTVSNRTLLAHLPGIDFSGLTPVQSFSNVKVSCSVPSGWISQHIASNALYTIEQWKSPSFYTGAGVLHANLPFPVNAKALLWLAKLEYSKKDASGKSMGEWTDELGRPWFEAENDKLHVRGYAITSGFDAWIVVYGYKLNRPVSPSELSLAARCVDTVIPHTGDSPLPTSSIASNSKNPK